MGTPERVADTMQGWFEAGVVDGFMMNAAVLPVGLTDFLDGVLPILRGRGLFRAEYEHGTLHENLGLAIPPNRYEAARAAIVETGRG